jgi:hypothetical protein
VIINCHAGGNCQGGNPAGVYEFAYTHGIPDDTCQQYKAANPPNNDYDCKTNGMNVCKTCSPTPPPAGNDGQVNCTNIIDNKDFNEPSLYFVSEFGLI